MMCRKAKSAMLADLTMTCSGGPVLQATSSGTSAWPERCTSEEPVRLA